MTAQDRISTGEAWAAFCDELKEAGQLLLHPDNPTDSFTQAEGVRYLTRLLRMGFENFIEYRDPLFPELRRSAHETIKLGGDNPDNFYSNAAIDGRCEYRITGTRGTVHYLGFGTQEGNYGKGGTLQTSGYLEAKDMQIKDDGSFEVIASVTEQPGKNWLPMSEKSSMLLVRQTFADRKTEVPAELKVERIGQEHDYPRPWSAERMERGLNAALAYVTGSVKLFLTWTHEFSTYEPNTFKMLDPQRALRVGGDPNIRYFYGMYEFAEDEALIVETPVPDCDFWNIQLCNFWMESFDYRYFPVHLNSHMAQAKPDGSVAVIVAHEVLDKPNAICTAGHKDGVLMWRWIGAADHPVPAVRKVKLAEL